MSQKTSRSRFSHNNSKVNVKDLSSKLSKLEINNKSSIRRFSAKTFTVDTLSESIKNGKYKRIVVLAGAGISTPSGIPDFRTPGTGLYDNLQRYNIPYPEAIFELSYFYRNPKPFFDLAKELYPGKYFPNIIHYFIRYLYDQNSLHRVYTQNIDGLERMAGIPPEKIVEAHGSFMNATCQRCRQKYDCEEIRRQIFDDKTPKCTKTLRCNGIVKPDIVFFGEDLPRRFQLYVQDLPSCDLCIVMGTSLAVYPFADIVDSTTRSTARLLINRNIVGPFLSPRPYDVTMIGDLEDNIKELLTKLDVIGRVMELMKQENEKHQHNKNYQGKSSIKSASTSKDDRLKIAETFLEQRRKFSTSSYYRPESQYKTQQKYSINESTKLMVEKHNNSLLFNRRRSKSTFPILQAKYLPPSLSSSSSSSSSSDSLNSSLSEGELMPFSFKRTSDTTIRPSRHITKFSKAQIKNDPLLTATLRTVL